MMKIFHKVALFGLGLALLTQAAVGQPMPLQQQPPALIEGVWLINDNSELTIVRCPEGFCGHLTKIVVPERYRQQYGQQLEAIGTNYTDENNNDPALRKRPIQGLKILTLRSTRSPWKFEGEVYSPEDGNTYSGTVEAIDVDRIKLKGCVLYVLCQEHQWQRIAGAPAVLPPVAAPQR